MANVNELPGFQFIDHVAIAVPPGELEAQIEAYKRLGFREVHREDMAGRDQVREVLLRCGNSPSLIQLLEPLSPESPVAKQIEKSGGRGGLAHIAFRVADVQSAFNYMRENGFEIVDPAPRKGSRGTQVFFVHPKSTRQAAFGYPMEVVQESEGHA